MAGDDENLNQSTDNVSADPSGFDWQDPNIQDVKRKTFKIISIVASGLFIISLVLNIIQLSNHKDTKKELAQKDKKVQELAQENVELENQLNSLKGVKQELNKSLETAYDNMADKDILITRLNKENKLLKKIRDKVTRLNVVRQDMDGQLNKLNQTKKQIQQIQQTINQTIEDQQSANQELRNKLEKQEQIKKENLQQNTNNQ